ncbi:MAG: hypothetical protein K0U36_03065 [Alphaproteobacteria bacterium]|nr:hypothetical protein [Alphaproteobacteria bacterium]
MASTSHIHGTEYASAHGSAHSTEHANAHASAHSARHRDLRPIPRMALVTMLGCFWWSCLCLLVAAPAWGQFDDVKFNPDAKRIFAEEEIFVSRYPITDIQLTDSAERVVIANSLGQIIVFQQSDSKVIRVLRPHGGSVSNFAILNMNTEILSAGWDSSFIRSSLITGRVLKTLSSYDRTDFTLSREAASASAQIHRHRIYIMAVSRENRYAATADQIGRVIIWDLRTQQALKVFRPIERPILTMAFSPDSRTLAIGGAHQELLLIPWQDDEVQIDNITLADDAVGILSLAFIRDGRILAVADGSGRISVYDTRKQSIIWETKYNDEIFVKVGFAYSDRYVVGVAESDVVLIWDRASGREIANLVQLGTDLKTYVHDAINDQFIVAGNNSRLYFFPFDAVDTGK